MKHAIVFPGQGAQYKGMGKELYDSSTDAKSYFNKANDIVGFDITDIMINGTDEDLRQTKVTQPAVFLQSVIKFLTTVIPFQISATAGHSLGEFSALVASQTLSFESALALVKVRALAMQKACEIKPSTMAAVLKLDDEKTEMICNEITDDIVVAANYNCPGQLVISGTVTGIQRAMELVKSAGGKAIALQVGGAFHSPLMEPARQELAEMIQKTQFAQPKFPIYQNVTAKPETDADQIKLNCIAQLTAPVRWTQTVLNMHANGITNFAECGPGNVLQGLIKKCVTDVTTSAI